jgi:hypothetical protein
MAYNKTKIFLFLFFIVIAAIFIVQIVRFFDIAFAEIDQKNSILNCNKFKLTDIAYTNNNLYFSLENLNTNSNITKVRVKADKEITQYLEPQLPSGQVRDFIIKNISINKKYYIYINDCNIAYESEV